MARWPNAAVVIAGWMIVYLGLRRREIRASAEIRRELQQQIDSLSERLRRLEAGEDSRSTANADLVSAESRSQTASLNSPDSSVKAGDDISAETLAAITETITGLVGRKVHIRSVRQLHTPEAGFSSWAQQGRVVVQASHNLAQRGRD